MFIAKQVCTAQGFPNLQFNHITAKDGLSSNLVTCVVEDKQGFIWIGTSNGLNRWDGYRFKKFFHNDSDSSSLIHNAVQTLFCDSHGRLWIATESGVSCYITAENRFVNYDTKFKPPFYINNNSSVRIYEDENKTIWLTNERDVIYRVTDDMKLAEVKIQLPAFYLTNIPLSGYDKIFRDRQGNEWAFKVNRIYRIDKKTKQPLREYIFKELNDVFIQKIFDDKEENFWVATWGRGVFRFYPDKGAITGVASLPERVYLDIAEWKYKDVSYMVAPESNLGLYLVDKNGLASANFSYITGDPSSLDGNNFSSVYIDSRENLWIASNTGVHLVKSGQSDFEIIPVTDPGTNNFSVSRNGPVYSSFETDSSIWLSKRFISTFEYNKDFRIKNFYRSLYPLSANDFRHNGYAYYFFKKDNELVISTDSGLVVYDINQKASREYFPEGKFSNGVGFRTILPFKENEIIVRTSQYGLYVFNTVTKKFVKHYNNEGGCNECLPLRLSYLFRTRKGNLFVTAAGSARTLFIYNPTGDKFEPVQAVNDKEYSMQATDLYGLDEDSEGNLWIAGNAGLFVYNLLTKRIVKKLPGTNERGGAFRVCIDNNDNAWINGNSGIWCYVKSTGRWIQFNNQDGLPGSSYDGIITRTAHGDILAGLEGAVAIFHTTKIFNNKTEPPVIITEAGIQNKEFNFQGISGEKKLVLRPGENSFSVDFALLNYMSPSSNRYYYKLSPGMQDFKANNDGHINFNGLAPGTYTLHVKGGDKAGNIFEKEDVLEIIVEPRWYQTNIFKLLAGLVIAAFVFFFVRWRIGSVRKEATFKQKIAETEMQALRAQMNPHFIFNSLNSIENFILQNEKRLASDYLNKFSKLIRSILDSSRDEVVPLSKDMEALQLYVELEQLRFNNKFRYDSQIDPRLVYGDYKVPSLLIQPYVENAIIHGIAHSDKKDLQLSVRAVLENDRIRYTICDNGVGREQADEYRQQNKPFHKSVGLNITADRVAHFNGQQNTNGAVQITDLYDDRGPAGTKVEIIVKAI